jgi:hypothetical protein
MCLNAKKVKVILGNIERKEDGMFRQMAIRLTVLLGLTMLLVTGCSTVETRVQPPGTVPQPSWIMGPKEPAGGLRYYTGIAVAENMLEEQQGRRRALTNAAELAAQSIANDIEGLTSSIDTTEGAAHRGNEKKRARITEEVKARTSEIVRGMNPNEYYYECWQITNNWWERLWDSGVNRYKYYVLCTYPQAEYERLMNIVTEKVK